MSSNVAVGSAASSSAGSYNVIIGRSTVAPGAVGCVVLGDNLRATRNFECLVSSAPTVGMVGSNIDQYIDFHTNYNNTESRNRCIDALRRIPRR